MDLKQIRYFLSIAETLNFTLASEQNNISQPALTKSIQKLEEELGGLLVIRDGKNTRLTELGQIIRNEFENIVKTQTRIKSLADNHLRAGHHMLNIGIIDSLGPEKFINFFSEFLKENPNTQVIVHKVDQSLSEDAILSGDLDACICTQEDSKNHKIKSLPLFEERILLAFASGTDFESEDEIELDTICNQNYFDRLNCDFRSDFQAIIDERKLDIRPTFQTDREEWIQFLVASGKGVCMLGEFSALIPGISMRPIKGLDIKRTASISMVFGSSASEAIMRFERLAKKYEWKKH